MHCSLPPLVEEAGLGWNAVVAKGLKFRSPLGQGDWQLLLALSSFNSPLSKAVKTDGICLYMLIPEMANFHPYSCTR